MYFGRAGDVPSAASKTFAMVSVCDRLADWEIGRGDRAEIRAQAERPREEASISLSRGGGD